MLYKPEAKTKEAIISIHGMQSNCLKKRENILAKETIKNDMAYFTFNNRGHDLMAYTNNIEEGKKLNGGSIYEDILDSYYDITGAINKAIELGFDKIHLQGHSLGCTKIIYTYNKLKEEKDEILNKIESIILLSLVDIADTQKVYLANRYEEILNYALEMERKNKQNELMPVGSFIHPISVKTYLRYFKYNEKIDFAKFNDNNYDFRELNNIDIPIFLRWGNIYELVVQNLDELVKFLKDKIHNKYLDIGYINGADHGYSSKEEILAKQIIQFCKNVANVKK